MTEANQTLFNLTNSKKNVVLQNNGDANRIFKYISGDSIVYKNIYVQNETPLNYYGKIYESDRTLNIESENINISGNTNFSITNNSFSNIISYDDINKKIGYKSQSYITLTGGNPTFNWDVSGIINNAKLLLTGNSYLNFSNVVNGSAGTLLVQQDSVGGWVLNIPANSKVVNNNSNVLNISLTPNSITILTFSYDGNYYYWNYVMFNQSLSISGLLVSNSTTLQGIFSVSGNTRFNGGFNVSNDALFNENITTSALNVNNDAVFNANITTSALNVNNKINMGILAASNPASLFVQNYVNDTSAIFNIGASPLITNRHMAFGWADKSNYHRIKSAGAGNIGFTIETINSNVYAMFLPNYGFSIGTSGIDKILVDMTGNASFAQNLSTSGLFVSNNSILNANLTVSSNSTFTQNLSTSGLYVSNNSILIGNLTVSSNALFTQNLSTSRLYVSNNSILNGDLTVFSNATFSGNSLFAQNLSTSGLFVSNNSILIGNLTVSSNSTFTQNLSTSGLYVLNYLGIQTNNPTQPLDLSGDTIRVRNNRTIGTTSDIGTKGEVCWDNNYIYVCVSGNSWRRANLNVW